MSGQPVSCWLSYVAHLNETCDELQDKILLISNRSAFPPLEYVMKQNGLTFCHVNNMVKPKAERSD